MEPVLGASLNDVYVTPFSLNKSVHQVEDFQVFAQLVNLILV